MSRPFNATRRRHYSPRRHDVRSRQAVPAADDQVVWYRGLDGDHAFPVGAGYLRSRCKAVRWTTTLSLIDGDVRPCADCVRAIEGKALGDYLRAAPDVAPITESEQRLMDGNR